MNKNTLSSSNRFNVLRVLVNLESVNLTDISCTTLSVSCLKGTVEQKLIEVISCQKIRTAELVQNELPG